jgi:hypothetical protein
MAQSDFHLPVRPTGVLGKNRQFFTGTLTRLATLWVSLGSQLQDFDNGLPHLFSLTANKG